MKDASDTMLAAHCEQSLKDELELMAHRESIQSRKRITVSELIRRAVRQLLAENAPTTE